MVRRFGAASGFSDAGGEAGIPGAEALTTSFQAEMDEVRASMRDAARDATSLSKSLGRDLRSAFDELIFGGGKLSDVLSGVGRSMASSVLDQALTPVQNAFGNLITGGVGKLISGLTGFEKGGAFSAGRVTAFASGGIVGGPTRFPMRGGTGLMGEAGPEAIMPLARGPDGKLGVRAAGRGGRAVQVTMNITTPDAASFARSRSQVAAQVSRAISAGSRNL
jgi:phage-related minor tail protein